MKTYRFKRNPDPDKWDDIKITVEKDLKQIVKHSPTGMEWGYLGSGPADTALSILTDIYGKDSEIPEVLYMDFKATFIASMSKDGGELEERKIRDWCQIKLAALFHCEVCGRYLRNKNYCPSCIKRLKA